LLGFPASIPARWAYILQKVKDGDYFVDWVPITSTKDGITATFWVSADAIKINGVRVEVTATLQQQMADVMSRSGGGVSLLTPKLMDLMFLQAQIVLPPLTRAGTKNDWVAAKTMSTTENMITQSIDVDRMLIAKVGSLDAAKDKLVSGFCKTWLLDNDMIGKTAEGTQASTNYGWHLWDASQGYTPVTQATNAKGQPMHVWQQPGQKHGILEDDYSQSALFVLQDVIVDDQPMKLQELLSDPKLAPLASHQGVLKIFRQPGVPMVGV
jgi:hypothetical protein